MKNLNIIWSPTKADIAIFLKESFEVTSNELKHMISVLEALFFSIFLFLLVGAWLAIISHLIVGHYRKYKNKTKHDHLLLGFHGYDTHDDHSPILGELVDERQV